MKSVEFYLASRSPQRQRLLREAGYRFEIVSYSVEEPKPSPKEKPREYVKKMARLKAFSGAASLKEGEIVVGADTVVVLGEEILGKPRSWKEAKEMLRKLQGTTHAVLSAVALVKSPQTLLVEEIVESLVEMDPLSPKEIEAYLERVPYTEKAGGCDIENISFARVIQGSFTNVVGLPMEKFEELYKNWICPARSLKP